MDINHREVVAIYTMLRHMLPFRQWRMPQARDIEIRVTNDDTAYGTYEPMPHKITISRLKNGHIDTVIRTLAHEMVHLKLEQSGCENYERHDGEFRKHADQVCAELGFDPKEF